MSAVTARTLLTEAEYLEIERAAERRSEYYRGEMFTRAGATEQHVLLTGNLFVQLTLRLRGGSCRAYNSDMRVNVSEAGLYTYPDLSIACGERRFLDDRRDTLLNPVVLIEVLSPTTERYDRGAKFELYKALESLREYVLVAQDRMRVERYMREANSNQWGLTLHEEGEAVMVLDSVGCAVTLAEIYRDVELSAPRRSGENNAA